MRGGGRTGRPRGTGLPASDLAGRNDNVRVLIHLPDHLAAALRTRAELPLTGHLRVALTRYLKRRDRPAPRDDLALGPGRQVWLPRALVEQIEREHGVARREGAILAAVAAYVAAR
ncbi:MAG: hypothetical protein IT372_40420 [Polyangiaceae bacterium]|nr:hypothetical protein [Polyangiaceae bacterium]